ncbi:TPA: methyltransferase [Candidatus Woesearchaeota archaeon]|nr:methyltransferase [Candidatus Woesearchaeota archaeon]
MGNNSTGSKAGLAVQLSRLKIFESPDIKLEQYPTDSEVAAAALWNMSLLGDIEGKTIADLGCGTGILGIGELMLGAKKAFFVDVDKKVLDILRENLEAVGADEEIYEIIEKDITDLGGAGGLPQKGEKIDVVIQNPPFGTKEEHADKAFLETAFRLAPVVCSFHKTTTKGFVEAVTRDNGFKITHMWEFLFPLKQTQKFHKDRIRRIEVTCFRMERTDNR